MLEKVFKPFTSGSTFIRSLQPSGIEPISVLIDQTYKTIDALNLSVFWDIPHSFAGPQNIASLSTVNLEVLPKMFSLQNNKKTEWVFQDDTGLNDLILTYSAVIDPANGVTDTSSRGPIITNLKRRRARNPETGLFIDDVSDLFFSPVIISYALVYIPTGSTLGAGVTHAHIYALNAYYYTNITGYGQQSS